MKRWSTLYPDYNFSCVDIALWFLKPFKNCLDGNASVMERMLGLVPDKLGISSDSVLLYDCGLVTYISGALVFGSTSD